MIILENNHHATSATRATTTASPLSSFPEPWSRRRPFPSSTTIFLKPQQQHYLPITSNAFLPQQQALSGSTSSTALHAHSASSNGLIATATATTLLPTLSFLKLAIVFMAGGLFFSTAMAACTACYAMGMPNVGRLVAMARLVWEGVWWSFSTAIGMTRRTLLGKQKQRFRQAWRVFRQQLGETRRTAVEGVQAIRKEVQLSTAATAAVGVGAPGLIPLQYMVDRMMPHGIAGAVENALQSAMDQLLTSGDGGAITGISKAVLTNFDLGTVAPKLEAARMYDVGPDAMAFDCDVNWQSSDDFEATVQVHTSVVGATVPITIHNVQFKGPVRVVLTHLTNKHFPGFGAALVSVPSLPELSFDVRVGVAGGVEITKMVPRIRAALLNVIHRTMDQHMMWPKRAVIPSYDVTANNPETPILSAHELKQLEKTDPFLEAGLALGESGGTTAVAPRRKPFLQKEETNALEPGAVVNNGVAVDIPMPTFATASSKTVSHPQKQHKTTSAAVQQGLVWEHFQQQMAEQQAKAQHQVKMLLQNANNNNGLFKGMLNFQAKAGAAMMEKGATSFQTTSP